MHKEISKKNEKNLMLVWTCLETQKKKWEKKRKKKRKCYYEDLTPSWQGSINALLASFVPSFFCVGESISYLTQWHDNLLSWTRYIFFGTITL